MRASLLAIAIGLALLGAPIEIGVPSAPPDPNNIVLQTIHGTVTDAIGRPLANVAVSDGNQVAYTNSDGAYSLPETTPGYYQVTVSRGGLDPLPPRTVGPWRSQRPVDFVATYVLAPTLTPNAFDSATTSTMAIRVTTYTPRSRSCAFWRDTASGTVVPMAMSTILPRDETTLWNANFAVGGLAPGTYDSSAWTTDCDGHLLSRVVPAAYVVNAS